MFRFRPKTTHCLISTFVFGVMILLTQQTWIGDDWSWLTIAAQNPNFGWTEPSPFSRIPIFIIYMVAALKTGVIELYPRLFLIVFFSVYAWSFATLLEILIGKASSRLNSTSATAFCLAAAIFTFWPNNYEINLWHVEALHALGVLTVVGAFKARHWMVQALFAAAAFLTYESFVLLYGGFAALLLTARYPAESRIRLRNSAIRFAVVFVSANLLAFLTRYVLARALGQLAFMPIQQDIWILISNVRSIFKTLWLIHFYRANWTFSIINWIAFGVIAYQAQKTKKVTWAQIVAFVAIIVVSALPLVTVTYSARRAFFGPQILLALVFAYLVYLWLEKWLEKRLKIRGRASLSLAAIAVLPIIYLTQWGLALEIKTRNYYLLQRSELLAEKAFRECQSPCTVTLPPPNVGVVDDYVLPTVPLFYDHIKYLRFPDKQIEVIIK